LGSITAEGQDVGGIDPAVIACPTVLAAMLIERFRRINAKDFGRSLAGPIRDEDVHELSTSVVAPVGLVIASAVRGRVGLLKECGGDVVTITVTVAFAGERGVVAPLAEAAVGCWLRGLIARIIRIREDEVRVVL
jgi:hypothetical protein